jgi:uncharacterized lipoprotein YajG
MKKQIITALAILTLLGACQKKETSTETTADSTTFQLDWEAMSTMLIRRMNIEPGERILIVASP